MVLPTVYCLLTTESDDWDDAKAGRSAAELGLIQARYELARAGALLEHARGP